MRRIGTLLMLAVLAPALGAQAPGDSGGAHSRKEWRDRFEKQREARIKEALGLTDDQATKLSATEKKFAAQRRSAFEEMRGVHEALRGQLRPGVAANSDSVRKLLDAEEHGEEALAQLRHDERHEMATYLSPVQLAQLHMMRDRMRRFGMRGRMGRGGMGGMRGGMGRDRDGRDGDGNGPPGHGPEPI
ncbi:MAG TPA: Spy/CpxP family protein refolding chaperone [Gemmatimonadales bacterium]|nr:Spy/CpxP family protein refolding chaperone [Gemmatimonadales bacterium]